MGSFHISVLCFDKVFFVVAEEHFWLIERSQIVIMLVEQRLEERRFSVGISHSLGLLAVFGWSEMWEGLIELWIIS